MPRAFVLLPAINEYNTPSIIHACRDDGKLRRYPQGKAPVALLLTERGVDRRARDEQRSRENQHTTETSATAEALASACLLMSIQPPARTAAGSTNSSLLETLLFIPANG